MASIERMELDATSSSGLANGFKDLSPRELEILSLAATGETNREIGQQLGLTVHAVKFHLASVYRKLGVANRTEAAVVFVNATAGHELAARG